MTAQEYIQSGAIEQYVLGMASEAEALELEQMRRAHPEVHEAVVQFEAQLEQQCLNAAIAPPAELKERIFAAALTTAATPTETARVVPMQPQRKPVWMQYAAAAGVAILLGSVAMNLMLMGRVKKMSSEIAVLKDDLNKPRENQYAFISNPEITPVAMYGTGSHNICRCSLYWDKKTKKAYLLIHHLVDQPDDKDYQLWALVNGQPISAGVFRRVSASQPLEMPNIPDGASIFAVTLEKKGGSPQPTLEQMYLKGEITL
ncbi:MAG: anti-sigma factor [Dinghuibacter sp.]|nr:anti-sigma factor [Dinghuibacter sp.]